MTQLFLSLEKNKHKLDDMFKNSADYYFKYIKIFNITCAVVMCDALTDSAKLGEVFLNPLNNLKGEKQPIEVFDYIQNHTTIPFNQDTAKTFEKSFSFITSGMALLFIDGVNQAFVMSVQGYPSRSIGESTSEGNLRASKESFTETARKNMALVRRKIRSENLVIKTIQIGSKTKTELSIFYHTDYCPEKIVNDVISRIKSIDLPMIFEPGYISPFIDKTHKSLFSSVGYTERPDTFCAKLCEGKVGIIIDGTPYAIIYPFFFHENFVTNDDYTQRPYFASFIRILRYFAFIIATALPGFYVAFSSYAPQSLSDDLIFFIYSSQYSTPLPLFVEAILITIILEIIKEAGLRLPAPIGSSVSIVSALIIGDAVINAGLIGSAILIICAFSTIAAFIIPSFYEPIIIMRILFILLSGFWGIPGLAFATLILFINIACVKAEEINYTYMLNPMNKEFFKDMFFRTSWRKSKNDFDLKEKYNESQK